MPRIRKLSQRQREITDIVLAWRRENPLAGKEEGLDDNCRLVPDRPPLASVSLLFLV